MSTCHCVGIREGSFLLTLMVYIMAMPYVFFGQSPLSLIAGLCSGHPTVGFVIWLGITSFALWFFITGIRQNAYDHDTAPVFSSLVVIAVFGYLMCFGHYPKDEFVMHIARAFYLAFIVAGSSNLIVAYRARSWNEPAYAQTENLVRRQAVDILVLERENDDLKQVLRDPQVRRNVLKAVHPDVQSQLTNDLATRRFQELSAMFDRIAVR
jgi:hypothetical protein